MKRTQIIHVYESHPDQFHNELNKHLDRLQQNHQAEIISISYQIRPRIRFDGAGDIEYSALILYSVEVLK